MTKLHCFLLFPEKPQNHITDNCSHKLKQNKALSSRHHAGIFISAPRNSGAVLTSLPAPITSPSHATQIRRQGLIDERALGRSCWSGDCVFNLCVKRFRGDFPCDQMSNNTAAVYSDLCEQLLRRDVPLKGCFAGHKACSFVPGAAPLGANVCNYMLHM